MEIPIKAKKSATDEELAELGKTQLNYNKCTVLSEARDTSQIIGAPGNAVAILVDISAPGGKFVIGKHVQAPWGVDVVDGRVAQGEEQLLIWPWQHEWQYYAVGSIKIRYLVQPSTVT
ncbi:hypothetical protein GQ44DRAFT_710995 [Phaeosphaeriaceae sp. PMI808]|nr:hypothetical protein GQ44DRAFT_710995 [Phaeosphaeriaceae sp. PMI808]